MAGYFFGSDASRAYYRRYNGPGNCSIVSRARDGSGTAAVHATVNCYDGGVTIGPGNIYYDYIVKFYAPRGHDPGVADALRDPLFALHRIASRFRDLDQFRQAPRKYVPAPVRLFQSGDSTRDRLVLYDAADGEPIRAARVDGWHRLFAARVFGARHADGSGDEVRRES